ncbi:MAG: VWA domain-containing protein [Geminicoccaceae bacterium]
MIELLRPWVFFLLPLPYLAWRWLPLLDAKAALPVPAPIRDLIVGLSAQGQRRHQDRPEGLWLKALGWVLLLIALSGPHSRESILLTPTGRDLMVAVDLSASMEEEDMALNGDGASRYLVVREMLKDFIEARRGDRVGLIAYGHEAFLISPFSYDVDAVAAVIDELEIGLPGHRTDLGRAIGLAIKTFDAEQDASRVLVLLSDGEDNSGELTGPDAAALAAAHGIRIHTIGFASNIEADGAAILRTIAGHTEGEFFWAKSASDLTATSREISSLEPTTRPEEEDYIMRDWSPYAVTATLVVLALLVMQSIRNA